MAWRAPFLDDEERAWRDLCTRFAALGDEDWDRPGASGDWTPKHVLAHIACWHAEVANILECVRVQGQAPPIPQTEQFNADAHERTKHLTLREVQAMSGGARHRFREELAQAPEGLPDDVRAELACSAHDHYAEHLPELDAFLRGRAAS